MKYFTAFMCIVLVCTLAGGVFGLSAGATFTDTVDGFGDSLSFVDKKIIKPARNLLSLLGLDLFGVLDDPYYDDVTFHRLAEKDKDYIKKYSGRDFSSVAYAVFEDEFLLTSNLGYYHELKGTHALDFVGMYFDEDGMLLYAIAYRNGEAPDQGLDVTSFLDQSYLNVFARQLIIRYVQPCKEGHGFDSMASLHPNDLLFPEFGAKDATGQYLGKEWKEGIFESHFWWIG